VASTLTTIPPRATGSKKEEFIDELSNYVGFDVLTAVSTKMAVFCVVAPARLHGATTQKTAIYVTMN
jgi:hypothetical protein